MSDRGTQAVAQEVAVANAPRPSPSRHAVLLRAVYVLFALAATAHLAWFYVIREQAYLEPVLFEHGLERMPFQGRMLMELPMRWAHGSPLLARVAAAMSATVHLWIRRPIIPEDLVELPVDFLSIGITGLVARALYRDKSRTGLLTGYVYPLALVMIAVAYALPVLHFFRFVYDLPAMALFSVGVFVAHRRSHPVLFAAVFILATVNRETSIFLLPLFAFSRCMDESRLRPGRLAAPATLFTSAVLATFWAVWHVFVNRHFAHNPTEASTHVLMNVMAFLWPYGWTQMAGVAAFLLPLIVLYVRRAQDPEVRLWGWTMLVFAAFLFVFGIVIETRIFGELTAMFAAIAALWAEDDILARFSRIPQHRSVFERGASNSA